MSDDPSSSTPSFEAFERQQADLERWRERLGDNPTKASQNAITADNDVRFEIGHFEDKPVPADYDWYGILIRTRREGIKSALNSADTLNAVSRLEGQVAELKKTCSSLQTQLWIVIVLLVSLMLLHWK